MAIIGRQQQQQPPRSGPTSGISSRRGANPNKKTGKRNSTSCLFIACVIVTIFIGVFFIQFHSIINILMEESNNTRAYLESISNNNDNNNGNKNIVNNNNKNNKDNNKDKPIVVGYAISLIKCSDKQTFPSGLIDASLVIQHSVHMQSIRNPSSGSKYDYKMYAIVHVQAESCSQPLKDVGFEIMIVDTPAKPEQIKDGTYLQKMVHREWCCGHDEFIKLYMYKIPEQIVVHVDIDFAFYKPMDELYDSILYDHDSQQGINARNKVQIEKHNNNKWPDGPINAFFTKDWPQAMPTRKAAFQAGFIVIRGQQPKVFDDIVNIIKDGNYTEGYGRDNGWGGAGYGAFIGAMAMQGLIAYYYDMFAPDTFIELNQCRYNWMGMDIRYNTQPSFRGNRKDLVGKCRNMIYQNVNEDNCENCIETDWSLIKNVHYTECRKPWNCVGDGLSQSEARKQHNKDLIDTDAGNLDKCLFVIKKWHELRTDLEDRLYKLTNDAALLTPRNGTYKPEYFMGHCNGVKQYYPITVTSSNTYKQVQTLYNMTMTISNSNDNNLVGIDVDQHTNEAQNDISINDELTSKLASS